MDFAAAGCARHQHQRRRRTSRDRFLAHIGPLADHAASLGMVIGLENPGNGEGSLMNEDAMAGCGPKSWRTVTPWAPRWARGLSAAW